MRTSLTDPEMKYHTMLLLLLGDAGWSKRGYDLRGADAYTAPQHDTVLLLQSLAI